MGQLQVPPKLSLKLLHFFRKFEWSTSSSMRTTQQEELPTTIGLQTHHNTWAHRRGHTQIEVTDEVQQFQGQFGGT
jgi:hypothetical protein